MASDAGSFNHGGRNRRRRWLPTPHDDLGKGCGSGAGLNCRSASAPEVQSAAAVPFLKERPAQPPQIRYFWGMDKLRTPAQSINHELAGFNRRSWAFYDDCNLYKAPGPKKISIIRQWGI